jgi:hypothetical protein
MSRSKDTRNGSSAWSQQDAIHYGVGKWKEILFPSVFELRQ